MLLLPGVTRISRLCFLFHLCSSVWQDFTISSITQTSSDSLELEGFNHWQFQAESSVSAQRSPPRKELPSLAGSLFGSCALQSSCLQILSECEATQPTNINQLAQAVSSVPLSHSLMHRQPSAWLLDINHINSKFIFIAMKIWAQENFFRVIRNKESTQFWLQVHMIVQLSHKVPVL